VSTYVVWPSLSKSQFTAEMRKTARTPPLRPDEKESRNQAQSREAGPRSRVYEPYEETRVEHKPEQRLADLMRLRGMR
jgi:hypothetical protein